MSTDRLSASIQTVIASFEFQEQDDSQNCCDDPDTECCLICCLGTLFPPCILIYPCWKSRAGPAKPIVDTDGNKFWLQFGSAEGWLRATNNQPGHLLFRWGYPLDEDRPLTPDHRDIVEIEYWPERVRTQLGPRGSHLYREFVLSGKKYAWQYAQPRRASPKRLELVTLVPGSDEECIILAASPEVLSHLPVIYSHAAAEPLSHDFILASFFAMKMLLWRKLRSEIVASD